jgi:hypothetical protein
VIAEPLLGRADSLGLHGLSRLVPIKVNCWFLRRCGLLCVLQGGRFVFLVSNLLLIILFCVFGVIGVYVLKYSVFLVD